MAERDGQIEVAGTFSEGQRQFVQDFVARLAEIDGVSGVALLSYYSKQTLCVIVPRCIGFRPNIAEPEVKAKALDVILEMRSMDGDFDYGIMTPVGALGSAGRARSFGGEMVFLWQRSFQ